MEGKELKEIINNEEKFRMYIIQTLEAIENKLSDLEEEIDSIAKDVEEIKKNTED